MEKRRRARINASLTELKSLLLAAIKKEGARQNKMEKADILEMAVRHLRHIQRQQFTGESSSETSEASKYQLGFHACVQEVCKYLDSNSDEDVQLKTKLLNHLANCVTAADCPTPSTSASTSSVVSSSPSSSSYAIKVSVSPKPSGQPSPSSCDTNNSLPVERSSMLAVSSQGSERPQTAAARPEIRPAINIRNFGAAVQQRVAHSAPEGILHAVLTSSSTTTNSALVKANMLSVSSSGNHLEARPPEGDRHSSHISSTSSETNQGSSVSEINNNSIILPALVNMAAPSTFTCVQQPHQLQQTQVYQQQQPFHHPQLQQQLFPSFADGSTMFASSNPLQLIPTKTVNGDIAFLLSTANLVSSSQIPGFSIPIITQGAVGHTQILAPPIPQQAIQIAVSYPPDDQQQPVTFIANSVQPVIQQAVPSASVIHSSIAHLPHQTTPLNLSSSTQHAQQTPPQLMPKRVVALPKAESEGCNHAESQRNYISSSPAGRPTELSVPSEIRQTGLSTSSLVRRTGLSEADNYTCPSYNIKSVHGDQADSMQQTPSMSWHDTAPADAGSLTFTKQSSSYMPKTHTLVTDTAFANPGTLTFTKQTCSYKPKTHVSTTDTIFANPGSLTFTKQSSSYKPETDASTTDTAFANPGTLTFTKQSSSYKPETDASTTDTAFANPGTLTFTKQSCSYKPETDTSTTDTHPGRSVYLDTPESRLADWETQLGPDNKQDPGGSGLSTQRHFFRPWRE